jgi:hypothetical protein
MVLKFIRAINLPPVVLVIICCFLLLRGAKGRRQ